MAHSSEMKYEIEDLISIESTLTEMIKDELNWKWSKNTK